MCLDFTGFHLGCNNIASCWKDALCNSSSLQTDTCSSVEDSYEMSEVSVTFEHYKCV